MNNNEEAKIVFMHAFLRLYEKYSIYKITISQLSKEAGYHRNTFYKHFSDIYELLEFTKKYYASLIADKMAEYKDFESQTIVDVFSQLESEVAENILTLLKRNNENFFSRIWIEECKKVWRSSYLKEGYDNIREYVFEYKVAGSIAVLSLYLNRRDISFEEITTLMHELTSTNKWGCIK